MHKGIATCHGYSLALAHEQGLLVIPGKELAEARVLPGLQHAPEEVACEPCAPQRHSASQKEALGRLEETQAIGVAGSRMRGPCGCNEGAGALHGGTCCLACYMACYWQTCWAARTVRSVILCERVTAVTAKPAVLKPAITRALRFRACAAHATTQLARG